MYYVVLKYLFESCFKYSTRKSTIGTRFHKFLNGFEYFRLDISLLGLEIWTRDLDSRFLQP